MTDRPAAALLNRRTFESLDELGLARTGRRRVGGRRVGRRLALQFGHERPSPRLLVQRKETGPVDPGDYPMWGPLPGSRGDLSQTHEGVAG